MSNELKIGDKVLISSDMSEILRKKYNESWYNLDYYQKENIMGRADFSGRIAKIKGIICKSDNRFRSQSGDYLLVKKYVLDCSKEQVFDEEFLSLYIDNSKLNIIVEKFGNNMIKIIDREEDFIILSKEEVEALIKSNLEVGEITNNLVVWELDNKLYLSKPTGEIISLLKKDLKEIKNAKY